VRREGVIGQGFPVGKECDAQLRCEKSQLILQTVGVARIGGDDRGDALASRVAKVASSKASALPGGMGS